VCSSDLVYIALSSGVLLARNSAYYLTLPKFLGYLPVALAFSLGWLALTVVLPLWILLTDRPSGWEKRS
jgi:hypothetical protein